MKRFKKNDEVIVITGKDNNPSTKKGERIGFKVDEKSGKKIRVFRSDEQPVTQDL